MKTKKEIVKKVKVTPKKKVIARVRTVSAVKKVVKKTKTAAAPKKTIKKTKTMAAPKLLHAKTLASNSQARQKRIIMYRLKRLTYMIMALAVGILSAGFLLGLMERIYLENSFKLGTNPITHQFLGMQLFLLPVVYVLIFGAGIAFGAWLGFWGWRMVYIEHRHRMYRKN
jgi:hypothetical protein